MALFSRRPKTPVRVTPIDMHWDTEDPFLFASHHEDDYPKGNRQQAPPLAEIGGRDLGRDYEKRLGFRMYHGKVVPGFPMHAHWGYDTLTYAHKGLVDHFDHMGTCGRFGNGDAQWVHASSRYSHNEMYPLADQEERNPNDITQIFVNLPAAMKNGENSVTTVWSDDVPMASGEGWTAKVFCGAFGGKEARSPAPDSWADPEHGVRIVRVEMEPGCEAVLGPAAEGANRNLYVISGSGISLLGADVPCGSRAKILENGEVRIENGAEPTVAWLLEGVPIGEKMAMFGPVCLEDIGMVRAGLDEIRANEYKEWPWTYVDQAQPLGTERFIRYGDGTENRPRGASEEHRHIDGDVDHIAVDLEVPGVDDEDAVDPLPVTLDEQVE